MSIAPAGAPKLPPSTEDVSGRMYPVKIQKPETGNLISDLGHYGGLHREYRIEDLISLELKSVAAAVELAKKVNIIKDNKYATIRDILPDKDFVDGNGNIISGRAWRQPWSGFYTGPQVDTDVTVYKINRDVDFHNKVYVFWGLRYVNRGPSDTDAVTDSTSITIKDGVNTYDTWNVEGLDVNNEMYAFRPLLVKNFTDIEIKIRPKVSGGFDNIQLLGKICEPRGQTIAGSPDS